MSDKEESVVIPLWRYNDFCQVRKAPDGRRWGQHFYDYLEMHKMTSPANKAWADRLYQEPNERTARAMVIVRLDNQMIGPNNSIS